MNYSERTDSKPIGKSTYTLKNKLNEANWYVFYQEFSDYLQAFGKAGEEIRDGVHAHFVTPRRTANVSYVVVQDDNTEITEVRQWKDSDETALAKDLERLEHDKQLYRRQKAELWIFLITNMEEEVILRLKTQQNIYDDLQRNGDTLGLFNLMKSKLLEADSNRASVTRQKWHELRQRDPTTGQTMSLMELLVRFEGYIRMLAGTRSEPSPEDQVQQLLTALIPGRYSSYTERIITDKLNPDLQEMKDALVRLENNLPKLNSNSSEKHADNHAMVTFGDTNNNQKPDTSPTDRRSKAPAKNTRQSPQKSHGYHKKSVTKNTNTDPQCQNCDGKGHTSTQCKRPKVTCHGCKKQGHLLKYCRQKQKKSLNNNADEKVRFATDYKEWADEDDHDNHDEQVHMARNSSVQRDEDDLILLDSGATVHVFINDRIPKLHRIKHTVVNPNVNIYGINGTKLPVTAIGFIKGIGKYYVVPQATVNLLSIPELLKHDQYTVTFEKDLCKVKCVNDDGMTPPLTIRASANSFKISVEALNQLIRLPAMVAMVLQEEQYPDAMAYESSNLPKPATLSKEQKARALQVLDLHYSLNHPSNHQLTQALDNGAILGSTLTASDVRNAEALFGDCVHCLAGKTTSPSYKHSSTTEPAQKVGDKIHIDVHQYSKPTVGGNNFYITCLDEFSGHMSIFSCKTKHTSSLITALDCLISLYKSLRHDVRSTETDHESALLSCNVHLGHHGIVATATPPYQHAQRIERSVRTMKERQRSILSSLPYEFPEHLYGELLLAICTSMNDLPNSQHPTLSPRMLVEGVKTDLNKRKNVPFGTVIMVHTPGKKTGDTLAARSELAIALGPSLRTYSAIRCYALMTGKVVIRNQYTILKAIPNGFPFPLKSTISAQDWLETWKPILPEKSSLLPQDNNQSDLNPSDSINLDISSNGSTAAANTMEDSSSITQDKQETGEVQTIVSSRNDPPVVPTNNTPVLDNTSSSVEEGTSLPNNQARRKRKAETIIEPETDPSSRRSVRFRKPKKWDEYQTAMNVTSTDENAFRVSVNAALKSEYASQSRQAIIDEINNMIEYKVGNYIKYKDIPNNFRKFVLQSFMFIKHKHKPDGSYDKTKARMVGNGSMQTAEMYDIISSSTVALTAIFLLLNIGTKLRAKVVTYDIKGAFLNAPVARDENPIYMKIKKEVVDVWISIDPTAAEFVDERGDLILELNKYIYGLRQAPIKFQQHLHKVLTNFGYKQSDYDDCVFTKHSGNDISMLSTHVDDILQVSTSDRLVVELRERLTEVYTHVTYHPEGESYVGMSIKSYNTRSKLKLTQEGITKNLIEKHLEPNARTANTPAGNDLFLVDEELPTLEDKRKRALLSVVMSLMYLARLTRPDILLPVTFLASRVHCATAEDESKLDRILRYLKGTINHGVTIGCSDFNLNCLCDASYGIHTDGKSHTGFIFTIGNSYLFARSVKQRLTALSSTDAEILAATSAATTGIWIRELHNDIMRSQPKYFIHSTIIHQDNKSGIWLITKPSKYRRSKHLLTKLTFLKELNGQKLIEIKYLPTDQMTGDMLTKPLQGSLFLRHVLKLMARSY